MFNHNPASVTYHGKKIIVAGNSPRMRLSADVTVTPEFRKEYDAWLKEFFGVQCVVSKGQIIDIGDALVCHPADYARLTAAVRG